MNHDTPRLIRISWALLLILVACSTAATRGFAQETPARTPGVYQRLAHPGEATVPVIVLGLGGSGLYDVGESVALDELLVLSGGTSLSTRDNKVTIRLYRNQGDQRVTVYEAPMEEMLVERSEYPKLQNGDLLYVEIEPRTRFTWRDGLNLFTTAASLTLLAIRISERF